MEQEFLLAIPCYIAYIWAVKSFCKKYLKITKINEITFALLLFGKYILINIANYIYNIPYILYALIHHIFFVGLIILLFRAENEKKILLASILITASVLMGNICVSLLSCLGLFLMHTVKNIATPFLGVWEGCIIEYIATAILILAIHLLSKRLKSVFQDKIKSWYLIIGVPLLAITTVNDVASWGATKGIMVRSGGNLGLYYDQLFSHAEFCVLTALSMFAAGVYVFGMDRIYLEHKKRNQYYYQLAVYKMLKEQNSQSERLRHDMKNHIISLSSLYIGKEWEKLGEYLKSMERYADLEAGEEITGNKVIDGLLYRKRKMAQGNNITWECDVQMPKECCINEFDLCVLFGNILDNALEACKRLRYSDYKFINIQSKVVKKCFLLEVKNSTDIQDKSNIKFTENPTDKYSDSTTEESTDKESSGLMEVSTDKCEDEFSKNKNYTDHGIGLLNVQDMVDKYNGVMNIEVLNNIFTISVLIPLESNA